MTLFLMGCVSYRPEIVDIGADPPIIEKGGSSTLTCLAEDADGDNLDYTWQSSYGSISGNGSTVIWTAPDSSGKYTITCIVEDGNGGRTEDYVIVSVDPFDIIGTWDVVDIEGSPISVDSSNNVWTFKTESDYEWSLLWEDFDLQGEGHYSFDGDSAIAILDGPATEIYGDHTLYNQLRISNNENTFSLLDSDGNRWTYNRRVE